MSDLVRPDPRNPVRRVRNAFRRIAHDFQRARFFNAPDGLVYCWRPHANSLDIVVRFMPSTTETWLWRLTNDTPARRSGQERSCLLPPDPANPISDWGCIR